MPESKQRHSAHGEHNPDNTDTRPYWQRAHHDFRFWIAILLMMTAIATYVMTQDLSVRPNGARVAPTPIAN